MPLEAKGVDPSIYEEIENLIAYAILHLKVGQESYKMIWYRLHIAPEVSGWPNAIKIAELLFSLPFTTCKVKRLFSQLKLIKGDRRKRLKQSSLGDLLEVRVEGPEDLSLVDSPCCGTISPPQMDRAL